MANHLFHIDMRLGEDAMDASHAELMQALEALASADDAGFLPAFAATVAALERDFLEEEARMDAIEYNGTAPHREQHAQLLASLHRAHSQLLGGDLAAGRRVVRLLPQWMQYHVWTMDQALAEALREAAQAKSDHGQGLRAVAAHARDVTERLQALRSELLKRIHARLVQSEARAHAIEKSGEVFLPDRADQISTAMLDRDLASLAEVEAAIQQTLATPRIKT